MVIAAVGDTAYNIVLFLHILTVIIAFAPAFVHPLIGEQSKQLGPEGLSRVFGFMLQNGRRIYLPALIVTGLLGFALAGMSDGSFELSQGWLISSVLVWIAMNGVLHAVVVPAERAVGSGDESAEGRLAASGGLVTILLLVMLYLMIFKPGWP